MSLPLLTGENHSRRHSIHCPPGSPSIAPLLDASWSCTLLTTHFIPPDFPIHVPMANILLFPQPCSTNSLLFIPKSHCKYLQLWNFLWITHIILLTSFFVTSILYIHDCILYNAVVWSLFVCPFSASLWVHWELESHTR